ncbi:MAG TPA: hypothetical protein VF771_11415, partial [Longimicrobiaceae bacterium]
MSAWAFRQLPELLRLEHPYVEQLKEWMDAIEPELWRHPERTPSLAPEQGRAVVSGLLELACQCQNMLNIELGRAGLLALPWYDASPRGERDWHRLGGRRGERNLAAAGRAVAGRVPRGGDVDHRGAGDGRVGAEPRGQRLASHAYVRGDADVERRRRVAAAA